MILRSDATILHRTRYICLLSGGWHRHRCIVTLLCIHSERIVDCILDDVKVSLLKALLLVEEFGAHLS